MTLPDRICQKIDQSNATGCHVWIGARNQKGYGRLAWNGKNHHAHRVIFQLLYGPIPVGMHFLHRCDNPSCVNQKHLYAGTNADNVRDRCARSKHVMPRGEDHSCAKLTERDVRIILAAKKSRQELAAKYGVTRETIKAIQNRHIWRHL